MKAFHSLWAKPLQGRELYDFEVLTMVLSALKWREKNGEITLVTDEIGYKLLENKGVLSAWDNVSTELQNIPSYVSPKVFWAAGKIYALRNFCSPIVSIDTDFIVWDELKQELLGNRTSVIHKENLSPNVYPNTPEFAEFDDGYSWNTLPCNTAFVYFGNDELIKEYTKKADNVFSSYQGEDTLCPMVFAEQRLLSMVADKLGQQISTFSSFDNLVNGKDSRFTHLWGYKKSLFENKSEREKIEEKLRNRIRADFKNFINKKGLL